MQIELVTEVEHSPKIVTEKFYAFHIERKKVEARISMSEQKGYTPFVEMEIVISNLRICKFYFSEIPDAEMVARYLRLIFEMHYDDKFKMPL
jgi:hypothetical protein